MKTMARHESLGSTPSEKQENKLIEAEAIRRAQQGDEHAFEYLYKSHCKRVFGICYRMLRDRSDAEDVTQQVFLGLFRKIGTFRGDACFSTWLHRVTFNAALMHLRKRKPEEIYPDSSATSADSESLYELSAEDTSIVGTVDRLNLTRAIQQLAPGYKRLFLLHDVMGYEHREIAELVGCSVGCSKSQVFKARRRLRVFLQGQAEQLSATESHDGEEGWDETREDSLEPSPAYACS